MLKASYGIFAEYTYSWNAYNALYRGFSVESAYPYIYIRFLNGNIRGLWLLVDTVPLYMDGFVGVYNALT